MKKIYLLTTGLCLSFAVTFQPTAAVAQSPGGVSGGLALWLRADAAGTLGSTDSLNTWNYFNIPANVFTSSPNNRPIVQNSTFNFLPSVFFNGAQQMDGPTGASAPITAGNPAYSIFAVWSSNVANSTPQRVWSQRTTGSSGDGGALWLYNGFYGDQPEISPYTQGLNPTNYTVGLPYISQLNLLAQNSSDLQIVDQTNFAGAPVVLSTDPANMALTDRVISNVVNRLGSRNVPTEEPFIGNLAELIVFNNSVDNTNPSANARNQIFSYLAMKYGINLGTNLVASDGVTIPWNATTHATYNHDVFGLGQDITSGLAVSQSNSSTTGGGSGGGQSGAGNITLSTFDALAVDKQFLFIGHDNNSLTESTFDMPALAAGSMRLGRNWWAQNTNFNRVNLDFDFTGITTTGTIGTTSDFRLMVNDAGDPTFSSGNTEYYTPSSFTGNVAHFTAVNLPDGNVFAMMTSASGAVPLPVNFITFTAQPSGANVDLNWTVGDNDQANTYEIERSSDDKSFSKIGEVANSADLKSYSFVDANAGAGTHYYRVLETDLNGKSVYSKVVSATISAGDFAVSVLNNPSRGGTNAQLQINAVGAGTAFIELWTVGGHRMSLQQEAIGAGTTTIPVPTSGLPAGSYVLKVMVGNNTHVTQVVKL